MKDRENIKNINKLSIAYIMLKGLKGQTLEKENPFLIYLMYNMFFKERNNLDENKESTPDEFKNNVYLIDCLGKGYYLKNDDNTIQIKNINKY